MDYQEFKEKFKKDVEAKMVGEDVEITTREVKKLNDRYDALTITPEGSNIGVNLPMDRFYNAVEAGMDYDEALEKAYYIIESGLDQAPDLDISELADYSRMKGKLAMEVVSAEANAEMLETVPHKNMEDMAIVYRFVINSDEDGRSSVLVTNQMIESMGITPEQLHADAMENAPQLKPVEIKGMTEVLCELMGIEQAEMMGVGPVAPEDEQMFVASVPDKVHGASVLAYEGFMEQAAERAGGDFYILPSSLHEVLIVPDNGNVKLEDLESMVRDVNATQVAPEDKLTDSVYHYDSKDKIFELGEKFAERQSQKEKLGEKGKNVEEKTSDQPTKKSVLGDLKAKKEAIAKTPRKPMDKGVKAKDGKEI